MTKLHNNQFAQSFLRVHCSRTTKMEYRLTIIFIISVIISETNAISITCEFENQYYGYVCESVIRNQSDEILYELLGKHRKGFDVSSVVGFRLQNQNLTFFPRNIEKKLPKLAWIDLSENEITNVTNEHLRPHQMLIRLDLNGNHIFVIQSNLFDGLPMLRSVHLKNNNIMHVDNDVMLPPDFYLYLQGNPCISEDYYFQIIINLSIVLQDKCPPAEEISDPCGSGKLINARNSSLGKTP